MATKKGKVANKVRGTRAKHEWLKARLMDSAWIVMRVDDYATTTASRGQLYPKVQRLDDANKAIWGSESDALSAAKWAAEKFGNTYAVFKLTAFVERAVAPVKTVRVG